MRYCRALDAHLKCPKHKSVCKKQSLYGDSCCFAVAMHHNHSSSNGYKAENDRACTMHEWDEKCKHFGWKTPREKTIWRLHTDGRIILKFIVQK
jgi:hypothetical protein